MKTKQSLLIGSKRQCAVLGDGAESKADASARVGASECEQKREERRISVGTSMVKIKFFECNPTSYQCNATERKVLRG